jgi:hypothetical protein
MSVWIWLILGRWQKVVFRDTIWMDRQNTGPEKGRLDGNSDTVRTDTNVVCVPDLLLRMKLAIMRYLRLVGRVHAVGRSFACSRAFDRNRTAESPVTL